jgi:putative Mg2+ transporter-C (MgtC) family protein
VVIIIELFNNLDLEMLLRLLLATFLGLAMGIERELKRKSLGLKTILVISIVSCLLTIVSIQSAYLFPADSLAEIRMDPLRLAAQIVSGVGFLGAGVILRRGDDTVSGLTTAAIVWGAAGIGIATGAGFYIEAVAGVVLLLVSVELVPAIISKIGVKEFQQKELYVRLTITDRKDIDEVIHKVEDSFHEKVDNIRIKDKADNTYLVILLVRVDNDQTISQVYREVSLIDNIKNIEIRA